MLVSHITLKTYVYGIVETGTYNVQHCTFDVIEPLTRRLGRLPVLALFRLSARSTVVSKRAHILSTS